MATDTTPTKRTDSGPGMMIDAVPINSTPTTTTIASTISHASRNNNNHWTPTLRGLSLLHTLVFLGLALSHTKLHTHAAAAASAVPTLLVDSEPSSSSQRNHAGLETRPTLTPLPEIHDVREEMEFVGSEEPASSSSQENSRNNNKRKDLILVAAVDGTLAAIERVTGKVLWKQDGGGSLARYPNQSDNNHNNDNTMKLPRDKNPKEGTTKGAEKLLQPLLATSTTVTSTKRHSSLTAAIPSMDGTVFLTTVENHPSHSDSSTRNTRPDAQQHSSVTRTDTALVRDIVARAPYVDPQGRFYVGSRQTTVAALDGDTGEILYVASADEGLNKNNNGDLEFEGRNIVWIGRVDYLVSVYNAKSSIKEVQFSASEIMSVNDMIAGKGKRFGSSSSSYDHDPMGLIRTTAQGSMQDDDEDSAALVATPSGNLAFRNRNTERVEWVADMAFDTPIAYAIHTSSGQSIEVDIIPDVTNPGNSKADYLRSEIERQIELTLLHDRQKTSFNDQTFDRLGLDRGALNPSIVGTLRNGQLYSMPLGRPVPTLPSHTSLATTRTQAEHVVLDLSLMEHQQHKSAAHSSPISHESHGLAKWLPLSGGSGHHRWAAHDERQVLGASGHCSPSSTAFPGCLFKAVSQRTLGIAPKRDRLSDGVDPAAGSLGEELQPSPNSAIQKYHPFHHGFDTPQHHNENQHEYRDNHNRHQQQQPHQHRMRKQNLRLLKILGSWLPPTIALIFVISFELGRRKRQRDTVDTMALEGNELVNSVGNGGNVIQITDQLLGLGSNGTQVFRGTLDGRPVAVKRILKTYVASADREISLLIESDGHPNVVRYFLKEAKGEFLFLALELCDLSLHSLIGTLASTLQEYREDASQDSIASATKRILNQIAAGVRHLHSLRIVHRDLKPANILLAISKDTKSSDSTSNEAIFNHFQMGRYVAKISDMGLGKILIGQSSFGGCPSSYRGQPNSSTANGHVGTGPGTVGWMAPEAMRVKSGSSVTSEASQSGDSANLDFPDQSNAGASRSVDIFSLGCIFYSTLVPGSHPFGEWYEREANIMHNRPNLEPLKSLSIEGYHLIAAMIQYNPRVRPTSEQVLQHPYFWTLVRRLSFICDLSDRLETDSSGAEVAYGFALHPLAIERNAMQVVGLAWDKELHKGLTEQKYRTYDPSSVRDLLRLIRNKKNHFEDIDPVVRQKIGSSTDGLMTYFDSCFPHLLMHCYRVCCEILPPDDPIVDKYSLTSANYAKQKAKHLSSRNSSTVCNTPLASEATSSGEVAVADTADLCVELASNIELLEDLDPQGSGQDDMPVDQSTHMSDQQTIDLPGNKNSEPDENSDQADKINSTESTTDTSGANKDELDQEHQPRAIGSDSQPEPKEATRRAEEDASAAESQSLAVTAQAYDNDEASPATNTCLPDVHANVNGDIDIVLWQGSTASKAMNCRGWIRSDEDWTSRSHSAKKRNANLMRCVQDLKFRTRLCNHWDMSLGTSCPMRKKGKCVFAHGPVELRIKEGKKNRWGKLVDKNGNNSNPNHSGGEDTYGAARSIESARMEDGKGNTKKATNGAKKQSSNTKKSRSSVGGQ
jgi:serine/threonine protein kinase